MPARIEESSHTYDSRFPAKVLHVNDGQLERADIGLLTPSSPEEPLDVLRERYEKDGYLFLKGLLPRDDVLKVRENYFKFLSSTGVLKPGTKPVEGIFDDAKDAADYPGVGAGAGKNDPENAERFVNLAIEAHQQPWYTDFCTHPKLKNFIARLSGWEDNTKCLRRTLLRNNTPGNKAIGVHYDQIFLRYGEPTSFTAWVPIGDVSIDGGGLIYLEDGHALGKEFEDAFTQKAKASGMTDEEAKYAFNQNMLSTGFLDNGVVSFSRKHNRRWLVTDYEAGDVVLHTPYTIHSSTINYDPENRIRLGTDLRYVDESKTWDTRWTDYYRLDDGV